MDKKELEKEAEEKYSEVDREFIDCQDEGEVFNIGYLAGAEPREKRIEELEKEIERITVAYNNCVRDNYYKTLDLEKENAELKLKLEALEGQTPWKDIKDKSEVTGQLTKAKDLLLRFIELKNKPCAVGHSINMLLYDNIYAEIKQFLNSEGK